MNDLSSQFRRFYTSLLPQKLRHYGETAIRGRYPRIFDKEKFIFIHIPKTAGKSLTKVLGSGGACHLSWRHYQAILEEKIESYYVFTIVRDPVDRLISSYTYMKSGGNRSIEDLKIKRDWIDRFNTFDEFVKESLSKPNVIASRKFRPQTTFLENKEGHIEQQINIFRFESLQRAYQEISKQLKIKKPLPHVNSSNREHGFNISPESAKIINEIYNRDFENLNYRLIN
ncbi:MAG: hypothetical protein ACJATD_000560 [Alloalcanivorax sp.]|jgi:hypothetical protein